jgi:phosphohistidine phosphatase
MLIVYLRRVASFGALKFSSTRGLVSRIKVSFQETQDEFKSQMKDWRGSSHSTSEFVTHFIAAKNSNLTVEEAILASLPNANTTDMRHMREKILETDNNKVIRRVDKEFRFDPSLFPLTEQLSPAQLLAMGSIWFLPADAPRDPQQGRKPTRMEAKDLTKLLNEGDYLRIHHSPRRFPIVNEYNWSAYVDDKDSDRPGLIIAEDAEKGYIVVSKPPGAPVHPTVDNVLENVAGAVGRSILKRDWEKLESLQDKPITSQPNQKLKRSDESLVYVVTPQRLDQNTSGVFVVATKKIFASYFAKLLRTKTDAQLASNESAVGANAALDHVQKRYKCLVCVIPKRETSGIPTSAWEEVQTLKDIVHSDSLVRHYLEPSFKAPRVFSSKYHEDWLECLLRIKKIGNLIPLIGDDASAKLVTKLWGCSENKPDGCIAVIEVEIELLTGRTHQIRGQLSTLGFPICGDVLYGGCQVSYLKEVSECERNSYMHGYLNSELLALQCCELSFLDPDYQISSKGLHVAVRSERMNKFRIEKAWWSEYLQDYIESTRDNAATTSTQDNASFRSLKETNILMNSTGGNTSIQSEIPNIQLSPGTNKYVIVKATLPGNQHEWYIKSASAQECNGQYHADVARQLVKDLDCVGFDTIVMGGGRIDYDPLQNKAHVYGFSYGYGKGDHLFVTMLIQKYRPDISATYDDSDDVY